METTGQYQEKAWKDRQEMGKQRERHKVISKDHHVCFFAFFLKSQVITMHILLLFFFWQSD